jgi:hypothetical protein
MRICHHAEELGLLPPMGEIPKRPDIAALRHVRERIALVPHGKVPLPGLRWDQWTYGEEDFLGRRMCFAGWTQALLPENDRRTLIRARFFMEEPLPAAYTAAAVAAARLGLSRGRSGLLFGGGNNLTDIDRMIAEWDAEQMIAEREDAQTTISRVTTPDWDFGLRRLVRVFSRLEPERV